MSKSLSLIRSLSLRVGDYSVLWSYASTAYDSTSGCRQKGSRVVWAACLSADSSCRRSRWFDDRFLGLCFFLENGQFLMTVFWAPLLSHRGEGQLSGLTPPLQKNDDHFLGPVFGRLFVWTRSGCHFLGRAWSSPSGLSSVPGFGPWH